MPLKWSPATWGSEIGQCGTLKLRSNFALSFVEARILDRYGSPLRKLLEEW